MLSRILSRTTQLRLLSLSLPKSPNYPPPSSQIPKLPFFTHRRRHFSTNNNDGGGDDRNPASNIWKISQQPTDDLDDLFGPGEINPFQSEKPKPKPNPRPNPANGRWVLGETDGGEDLWSTEGGEAGGGGGRSEKAGEFEAWSLEKEGKDVFEYDKDDIVVVVEEEDEKSKEERLMKEAVERAQLVKEKHSLLDAIQGTNRAFGDLIAASGITDAMLDSLIALKNFQDIEGLPPLEQIEDERYEKTIQKSSRYEMELQKQEEIAKSRVRKVDEQGRAYGTGKRKTSIARVWIEPGEGKFCINDREFDVYFPMLDHRATLLRPFVETKTLGLWDVRCTVKGGGTTGQVEAIRLGISRALQNWEPGLRPPLRDAGFLTRDPRIVERKKPGRAKARKSFQWVKR
ncbi:small ribosomal subunit protein uS9m [Silene latifolia]|uniref:small ribosomal subunit protein uS9m n=1 Tax=Silene latifolia TaxID=37657 RepID=UPI003D788074